MTRRAMRFDDGAIGSRSSGAWERCGRGFEDRAQECDVKASAPHHFFDGKMLIIDLYKAIYRV